MKNYKLIYKNWTEDYRLNKSAKKELLALTDEDDIKYRFGADLQFGTAGMRGVIGYGTNMMNVYTVRRATLGLAEYIKTLGKKAMKRGVAISFDTRRFSDEFAKETAGVLIANGIKVYLFKNASPVPMLSFAVRHFKAIAGVMITASHNPKEYNGYKVYGEDGAQMSPEATSVVVSFIDKVQDIFAINNEYNDLEKDFIKNKPRMIGLNFETLYLNKLKKLSLSKEAVRKCGKDLKIVYTPIHGTGYHPLSRLLKELGINVSIVKEQINPDPDFSTVELPNPEFKETLSLGVKLADKIKADVVFGTDPDSDRLGVAIRNNDGEFINLTGNDVGVLLSDYILRRLKEDNKLPDNGFIVKSFVSTDMVKPICKDYGVELIETPVGFKFIGEKIKLSEEKKDKTYIFGFEESCGYLRGTHARDKDAVVAGMLFAEMCCYYTYKNISVYDVLNTLFEKYGYYVNKTVSTSYKGLSAMDDMNAVVDKMRNTKIEKIGIYDVFAVRDYLSGNKTLRDGSTELLDIKGVNCIYYELEIGGFICLRPSGTEPKLKTYYSIKGRDCEDANKTLESVKQSFEDLMK